jgi:amino acid adenylation domain-containing protein
MPLTPRSRRPAPRAGFVPFDRSALDGSLSDRFQAQVDSCPDRLAVKCGAESWDYATLDQAANRVARAVRERVGPNAEAPAVVLLLDQGPALVAAVLAVLKAGGIYIPLETAYPPALVAGVASEAGATLVLTDTGGGALAREALPRIPALRVDQVIAAGGPDARLGIPVPPDAPAYVYYTSGSTGRPKGVVDVHRNVLHNVLRYTNSLGIDGGDRLTLVQSPGFSGAVSSLFGALLNGGSVFPYDVRRHGAAGLGSWLVRERITIYHSVPALFRLAAESAPAFPDLRLIRLEGDRMTRRDWLVFRERFRDDCVLVNGLGATECGLVRQYFIDRAMPVSDGVVPVGHPVEDMEVVVVDEAGRPVAPGAVGEITVRSRYLALGYHGRPDLTARAFASHPNEPGVRIYRTGDLGRLGPDGCLDHLGRRDARLRIRGEWVDLADVEAALLGLEGVREAAARAHGEDTGDPRLVGYIVPGEGPALTVTALRAGLASRLSPAALPSAYVLLASLPLTENGKVDRAALPPPGAERPTLDTPWVAPRTALERAIAEIWAEVLGIGQVGIRDPFFDLGGDSLGLSRVHVRLQDRLGVEFPIVALFEHPTIEALAGHFQSQATRRDPLAGVRTRAEQMQAAAMRQRRSR